MTICFSAGIMTTVTAILVRIYIPTSDSLSDYVTVVVMPSSSLNHHTTSVAAMSRRTVFPFLVAGLTGKVHHACNHVFILICMRRHNIGSLHFQASPRRTTAEVRTRDQYVKPFILTSCIFQHHLAVLIGQKTKAKPDFNLSSSQPAMGPVLQQQLRK